MTTHRILDDFYEHSYVLIAIHSVLEDYRLAYFLNLHLHTHFRKSTDIEVYNNRVPFAVYEWEDHQKGNIWNIISNTSIHGFSEMTRTTTLFDGEMTLKVSYLIPEQKKTDYFLRIDGEAMLNDTTAIVGKIRKIPKILSTYTIDPNQLKSKQNLIL